MRTPFVRGRDVDIHDTSSSPWVAIVNETAARRFWPGEDPIGKHLTVDAASGERPREVGVVRDVPLRYLRAEGDPVVYVSYLQQSERYRGPFANMFGQMNFLIRTSGDPLNLVASARRAVAEIEPSRPIANIETMQDNMGGTIWDRGFYAVVLGVFAFTATLLAAIGIYGVMAYSVAQRTREIGIRMALGATALEILDLIGRRAVLLLALGFVFGLAGAAALTRLISSQLWGVAPTDPLTFGGVSLLLAVVALSACLIPALRAVRVDPTEALRNE
jgi:putative ABC transport system permease protein